MPRHKCFVSYHSADRHGLQQFKSDFDDSQNALIFRGQAMPEDIVQSANDDYVMSQIRSRFLEDSTVTIVLVGACTWSRKVVDWELQSSLRQPSSGLPNGLIAILCDKGATHGRLPHRAKLNVESGYARFYRYPSSATALAQWIEDAYGARTGRASRIVNPRARKAQNELCIA